MKDHTENQHLWGCATPFPPPCPPPPPVCFPMAPGPHVQLQHQTLQEASHDSSTLLRPLLFCSRCSVSSHDHCAAGTPQQPRTLHRGSVGCTQTPGTLPCVATHRICSHGVPISLPSRLWCPGAIRDTGR